MTELVYLRPRSLDEALSLKAEHAGARFLAGGTDLLLENGCGQNCPETVISLRSVPELAAIEVGETTHIGAMTAISDILRHPDIRTRYPVLVQAARLLGSVQIRNAATIGGNLCRAAPCADMAPPLYVLEARVRLESVGGSRELAIEEFLLGPGGTALLPGEVLSAILIAPTPPAARGAFLKKGRVKMDLSLVSVAVLVEMENGRCTKARIAAGAVAPTPVRLYEVEALLEGKEITPALLDEARTIAAESVEPITDVRATEAYRRRITGVYVRRALEELVR